MKFVISSQELKYLISKCQNVVPTKAAVPILSNFLIEAKGGMLTITGTDLTVGVRCSTEAKIIEEGITALPAKRLAPLVHELTSANVEFSVDAKNHAEVIAGTSRFRLLGIDAKEYPLLPNLDGAIAIRTTQALLREQLSNTAFAVSREDNRYALTGVSFQIANGQATFVGTDGKRLARSYMPLEVDPSFARSCVIPLKAVEEVLKDLTEEGTVTIYLLPDKIAFESNQTLVISQLLSGEYPDVDRVIPQATESTVVLHREELASLLRQVALFVKDDTQAASVRFTLTAGELKLDANTMDIGEGKVCMPANYHGQRLDIAFNPLYFLDILRHCKAETVVFGLLDSFNPGVIVPGDSLEPLTPKSSPLFVLMPMRLSEV